jgi:SAM-dependent methyltransferase
MMPDPAETTKATVRAKYAAIAESESSCCAPSASTCLDMSERYDALDGYAADADLGLGCGLPTEMADLQPGEHVIDLGSGAGLDAFVARRAVGSDGYVLGVDMTSEMVEKARANAKKLDYANVDFRLGEIEALPTDDDTFDIVISNCVLNLVPDKAQAFREIFRVLRPGGRFVIADIVSTRPLPEGLREAAELYVGCIAGALPKADYLRIIRDAGFERVAVEKEHTVDLPDAVLRDHLSGDALADVRASGAGVRSITVIGLKPDA